jgi:hypothetical protein
MLAEQPPVAPDCGNSLLEQRIEQRLKVSTLTAELSASDRKFLKTLGISLEE